MDLTQLSDSDLLALQSGDLTKVSDAGLAVLNQGQPKSPTLRESFERGAGLTYRAVAPTLAGAQIGSYGGPLGALVGSMAVPAADAVNALLNVIASAVAPKTQAIVTPTAVMSGQTVTEATGNPLYGAATTLATGTAGSVKRPQKQEALSTQALDRIATDRYDQLQRSGVQLKTDEFVNAMDDIAKGLRQEGYTPKAFPKVAGAIEELTSTAQPKDWTELQALRKMIRSGQKSIEPEERRMASILLDDYDNYLMTVPKESIASGDMKNAGQLWSEARNAYSKMKKSEVFEDMLNEAKLDKSKFTQSGEENSLAKQLRQLAKNDKKMRLFTKDEQDAIEKAAKGGNVQNMLKFFGRFAPTGVVPVGLSVGTTALAPMIGIPLTIGAAGSRGLATNMRRGSVEDLTNMMRTGGIPQTVGSPFRAVTPVTARGLLSMEDLDQEQRNLLGIQ